MRKNSYPDYEDCDDAFSDLYNEVTNPNIEEHKTRLVKYIDTFYITRGRDRVYEVIKKDIMNVQTLAQFKHIYDSLWSMALYGLAYQFPANVMMSNVKCIENVKFVHYFPNSRLKSITKYGLYGRATPTRMTLTREVMDFYIKDNGFMFAYEYSPKMVTVVNYANRIEGVARKALSFHFEPDTEDQLIVPLKCVESYSVVKSSRLNITGEYDDMLLDPRKYRIGALTSCDECGRRFKMRTDSFYLGVHILCPECRKKFDTST